MLLISDSALGTPLEWPQAKQAADQVREWGIEVREGSRFHRIIADGWAAIIDHLAESKGEGERRTSMGRRGLLLASKDQEYFLTMQIEYLVVAFDDDQRKVRLSLCQAEILKALAKDEELSKSGGCVPELQKPSQCVKSGVADTSPTDLSAASARAYRPSIQNLVASCSKLRQESHGVSIPRIFWMLSQT
jgi:glutamate--cysteine ligase catalytic subunit